MTNAELIQKIKAKIERLKLGWNEVGQKGVELVLNDLLSFLDTLEEKSEKPMQEGLEEEITRTYHDGSVADTTEMDHVDYENIARHFYELGCRRTAEKYDEIEYNRQRAEESVPNDLEEAADEYANKHYSEWDESWDDYNGHNIEPENDKLQLMDAFIAGAKWMSIHGNDIKEL